MNVLGNNRVGQASCVSGLRSWSFVSTNEQAIALLSPLNGLLMDGARKYAICHQAFRFRQAGCLSYTEEAA